MNLIPNVNPKAYTLSAIMLGYFLIDDLTPSEQNALGNWLMLTAQILCTNAYYNQVQNERNNYNLNQEFTNKQNIDILRKMIKAINKEIENLSKK